MADTFHFGSVEWITEECEKGKRAWLQKEFQDHLKFWLNFGKGTTALRMSKLQSIATEAWKE